MSNHLSKALLLSWVCVAMGIAQTPQERERLFEISRIEDREWRISRVKTESLATVLRISTWIELPGGKVRELQRFENGQPLYYQTENVNAAKTISSDKVRPGGGGGLSLTGSGISVGVWEISGIRTSHQEFGGRITYGDAGTTSIGQHATHVSGTLIAAGVSSSAKGMAYEANLLAYTASNDVSEMASAAAGGLRVSSHSYGIAPGWNSNYFGDGKWAWSGNLSVSSTVDYTFGFYSSLSSSFDNVAYNAPNYLIVKSAGNDRNDNGPASGTEHWHFSGGWVLDFDSHNPDGGSNGFGCVSGVAVAKNVLIVGAVNDITNGYAGTSSVVMTPFSSWGPTSDGRIKPDIVANGSSLYSSNSSDDASYTSMSGTSMASPSAAGSIGLLLEHQKNLHGNTPLRSSSMKGIIIHTADEAGANPGPDYSFGWGLMNTLKAAQLMTANALAGGSFNIREMTLSQGDSIMFDVEAIGTEPLRVTISWTDPAGTPPSPSVNPPTKMLKNDLDLRVYGPASTAFFPWVLNPASPVSAATMGDNNTDNVEQVHIASPSPGLYTIRIKHKGSLLPNGSQIVSIIISGAKQPAAVAPSAPSLVSPSDGATGVITNPTLTWNAGTGATLYHLQLSLTNSFETTLVNQDAVANTSYTITGLSSQKQYFWRVRALNSAGTSDWSPIRNFTTGILPPAAPVLSSPSAGETNIPTSPTFSWQQASGATSYQLQVSSTSTFSTTAINQSGIISVSLSVTGLLGNTTYYWRVRALNDGGPGEWSTTRDFTTIATPPSTPNLTSPENGLIDASTPLIISWEATFGATSYRLQISTDSSFAVFFLNDSLTTASRSVSSLSNSTKYFWRVQARNNEGSSPFSEIWVFTTAPGAPAVPQLASPVGGSTVYTGSPVLKWQRSIGATSYRLQVSTRANFNQIFLDQEIADTAFMITGLTATTYYWRVSALNPYGGSSFSSVINFSASAPPSPSLVAPAQNSTGVSVPVSFSWNPSDGALTYQIQIATAVNFTPPSSIVRDSAGITTTSLGVASLTTNTSYHWRVRAVNTIGTGPFSAIQSFTTAGTTPVERDSSFFPAHFELKQNYPNPFNPSTAIRFSVFPSSMVTLSVHDIYGREVSRLVEGELPVGTYEVQFFGNGLSSGVYFYRLVAGEHTMVKKLVLLK